MARQLETAKQSDAELPRCFAVVPAAGRSRRMGQPKLLLPFAGQPLLGQVLSQWKSSQVTQTVVVLHQDDEATLGEICKGVGVTYVVPTPPPEEMKLSVVAALSFISETYAPQATDVWMVAPADMPHLTAGVIDYLLAESRSRPGEILQPTYGQKSGHPVLFPWSLAQQVSQLPADAGLNQLVRSFGCTAVEVSDQGILEDLDTPADYLRLKNQQNR